MQTTSLLVLGLIATLGADEEVNSARAYITRGMRQFCENRVDESIADFDRAAKLEPRAAPHLWQRGISLYYAGRFKEGRQQFESHKAVNPHDVENSAWHFLCVAKEESVAVARKAMIEIDTRRDTRVPMTEIYKFYAGRVSEKDVIAAADRDDSEQARMYAHLYLGLYHEVSGETKEARDHLRKAAAAKLKDHYMHDVAKVHLLQRSWNVEPATAAPTPSADPP